MTGVTQEIAAKKGKSTADRQVGGDHYQTGGTQHWDMFGTESMMYAATKYLSRWRKKNGVQDLEKALHYSEKLLEIVNRGAAGSERPVLPTNPKTVEAWAPNQGLTWVETIIIKRLMFWEGPNDIREAIDGIRHLIETAPKPEPKPAASPVSYPDKDGRELSVGDMCTWMDSRGNTFMVRVAGLWASGGIVDVDGDGGKTGKFDVPSVTLRYVLTAAEAAAELSSKPYKDMTTDELKIERAKLIAKIEAAPGWGAAVGQAQEWVNEIDSLLRLRERRVPRHVPDKVSVGELMMHQKVATAFGDTSSCGDGNFDRRMQDRDASLYPWHISVVQKKEHSHNSRWELLRDFYVKQGTEGGWRLDCIVAAHGLPKELQGCYDLAAPGCGWRIRISELPSELRDSYPFLARELNAMEHSDRPMWEQDMYAWEGDSEAGKYKLRHVHEAWAKD